jgi:hypothetical protein
VGSGEGTGLGRGEGTGDGSARGDGVAPGLLAGEEAAFELGEAPECEAGVWQLALSTQPVAQHAACAFSPRLVNADTQSPKLAKSRQVTGVAGGDAEGDAEGEGNAPGEGLGLRRG